MSDEKTLFVGLDLGKSKDHSALVCTERRMIDFGGGYPAADPRDAVVVKPPSAPVDIAHGHSPGAKAPLRERVRSQYVTTHVQRFELETQYPDVVRRVAGLFTKPQYAGQRLVIDQTGVGAAVVDMFRQARGEAVRCPKCDGKIDLQRDACAMCCGGGRIKLNARIAAIHIRGDNANERWRYDPQVDTYYVAKRELVSVLLVLMESNPGRFVIDPRLRWSKELAGELGMFRAKQKPDSKDTSLEAWRERDHDDLVLAAAMSLWFAERASKRPWIHL